MIKVTYLGAQILPKAHEKFAIKMFLKNGFTSHSGEGLTLAPIMNYCIENKIPFELIHYPGMGSSLKRIKDL